MLGLKPALVMQTPALPKLPLRGTLGSQPGPATPES